MSLSISSSPHSARVRDLGDSVSEALHLRSSPPAPYPPPSGGSGFRPGAGTGLFGWRWLATVARRQPRTPERSRRIYPGKCARLTEAGNRSRIRRAAVISSAPRIAFKWLRVIYDTSRPRRENVLSATGTGESGGRDQQKARIELRTFGTSAHRQTIKILSRAAILRDHANLAPFPRGFVWSPRSACQRKVDEQARAQAAEAEAVKRRSTSRARPPRRRRNGAQCQEAQSCCDCSPIKENTRIARSKGKQLGDFGALVLLGDNGLHLDWPFKMRRRSRLRASFNSSRPQ